MKLNKKEISAISETIKNSLITLKETAKEEFLNSKEAKQLYKEMESRNKELTSIYEKYEHLEICLKTEFYRHPIDKEDFEEYKESYLESIAKEKYKVPSTSEIENVIVLKNIDANDLSSLIEGVITQFKN